MATVRAAGGLVVRDGQILVAHRPRYDDWVLPKGKAEPEEDDLACALREVREETGYVCRPVRELAGTSHSDREGRAKRVRWWLLDVAGGEFAPNDEVDEIRWLGPEAAAALLSYEGERALLGELA